MVGRFPKPTVSLWQVALHGLLFFHSCFLDPGKFSASTESCAKDFTAVSLLQEGSHLCLFSGQTSCQFQVLIFSFLLSVILPSRKATVKHRKQWRLINYVTVSWNEPHQAFLLPNYSYSILNSCKLPFLSTRPQLNYHSAMCGTQKLHANHSDF